MTENIFPLQNTRLHLRYSQHFDEKEIVNFLRSKIESYKRKLIYFSAVRDDTDADIKASLEGTEFEKYNFPHTHVYIETSTEMRNSNNKAFTFQGTSPHIKKVNHVEHKANILKYHQRKSRESYACIGDFDVNNPTGKSNSKGGSDKGGGEGGDKKTHVKSIKSKLLKNTRDEITSYKNVEDLLEGFGERSTAGDISCIMSIWKTRPPGKKPEGADRDWWYEWKKELYDELLDDFVDPRKIISIVNTIGMAGKSDFVDYMVDHVDGAIKLEPVSMYHISTTLSEYLAKGYTIKTIIFDIPKDGTISNKFYETIEILKSGKFSSQKFKGEMISIGKPNIVIFSNRLPDLSKLSPDRWDLRILSAENEIIFKSDGQQMRKDFLECNEDPKFWVDYVSKLPVNNKNFIKVN